MSAWDITGAFVAAAIFLLTALVWLQEAAKAIEPTAGGKGAFWISACALPWLVFCSARLFGAHL